MPLNIRNIPNLVWGVLALIVLIFLFFTGRKAGIDKARKESKIEPLPDGGKTMGDWGSNPTNQKALKYAIDLAKEVFNVTDGAWVTNPIPSQDRRLNVFLILFNLGSDQLTSVYNQYNLNHGRKFWGLTFVSMTEAIDNEILLYGGDVRDKLVSRLKSLKLK